MREFNMFVFLMTLGIAVAYFSAAENGDLETILDQHNKNFFTSKIGRSLDEKWAVKSCLLVRWGQNMRNINKQTSQDVKLQTHPRYRAANWGVNLVFLVYLKWKLDNTYYCDITHSKNMDLTCKTDMSHKEVMIPTTDMWNAFEGACPNFAAQCGLVSRNVEYPILEAFEWWTVHLIMKHAHFGSQNLRQPNIGTVQTWFTNGPTTYITLLLDNPFQEQLILSNSVRYIPHSIPKVAGIFPTPLK